MAAATLPPEVPGRVLSLRDMEVRRSYEAFSLEGYPAIFVEIYNRGAEPVDEILFQVEYLREGRMVAADRNCGGSVEIAPGGTGRVGCLKRAVAGSDDWRIRLKQARRFDEVTVGP